jgi:hypothetical protein
MHAIVLGWRGEEKMSDNTDSADEGLTYCPLCDAQVDQHVRDACNLETCPWPSSVRHPAHYRVHPSGVECITIVEHMGFNLGNVVKYVWRADEKGKAIEDLRKAKWYLEREIARRESEK